MHRDRDHTLNEARLSAADDNSVCAPDDSRFMELALSLGRRGLGRTAPNPAVGAVVVRHDGIGGATIVGRGWTQPGGRPHAEVEALRQAGEAARGATLYVTLEPCSHIGRGPPCADAAMAAGIRRVVSAMEDPNPAVSGSGHARLRAAGIAVDVGVAAAAAREAHAGHILRMQEHRPLVILKMAVSVDGKVALPGCRPVAISGEEARAHVHLMRAQSDVILIGIGTAQADDPLLTCRLPGMADRSPIRVVIDTRLELPLSGRLAQTAREAPVWLITTGGFDERKAHALRARGVEILSVDAGARPDIRCSLRLLSERGITRLLVEGGPRISAAFLRAGLVDEVVLLRGPAEIGLDGIDAFDHLPLEAVTASAEFALKNVEQIGHDTIETFARRE